MKQKYCTSETAVVPEVIKEKDYIMITWLHHNDRPSHLYRQVTDNRPISSSEAVIISEDGIWPKFQLISLVLSKETTNIKTYSLYNQMISDIDSNGI